MKAIFLNGSKHPSKAFSIREVPDPQPETGEVLIRVSHFGLNFADVMMRKGLYRSAPAFPFVPGYDVTGTIEKLGNGVDISWLGKKVFALTRFGGYAEQVVTRIEGVAEVPQGIDDAQACALATQYCTALYAVKQCPNLRKGDHVLIHAAAGGVGIALSQLCKAKGLVVHGTAGSEEKIRFLVKNGVDHAINYRTEDYVARVNETGAKMMAVFNAIGGKTYKKDRKLLGPCGQHILFGGADRTQGSLGMLSSLRFVSRMGLLIPIALMMKSQGITGVNMLHVADHHPEILQEVLGEITQLAVEGKLKPHVHAAYPVEDLHAAHKKLEHRQTMGKLVVSWEG